MKSEKPGVSRRKFLHDSVKATLGSALNEGTTPSTYFAFQFE